MSSLFLISSNSSLLARPPKCFHKKCRIFCGTKTNQIDFLYLHTPIFSNHFFSCPLFSFLEGAFNSPILSKKDHRSWLICGWHFCPPPSYSISASLSLSCVIEHVFKLKILKTAKGSWTEFMIEGKGRGGGRLHHQTGLVSRGLRMDDD